MTSSHYDAWAKAKSEGTAVAYSGNEAGNTRNSRIDYVWQSKGATSLVLTTALAAVTTPLLLVALR